MRSFADDRGATWDVVVGRESWGAFFAIFVPRGGGSPRQAILGATGREDAERELEAMGQEALGGLLARAEPKELG